ncbi:MAG: PEGA domain-containing protein [Acidobacteria bacterium]|nr:PEGA domain-containing protein [Acidobacteriota bacterium]
MSHLDQLVHQAKTCFQAKDYEACISLTTGVLCEDPGNAEAAWLMKEAQRQWEDQRSLEELEIYVENLKKEAMDLFDKERYEQCMGIFRFLSELEPENHTLRDYVKLSQQMFLETIGTERQPSKVDDTDPSEAVIERESEVLSQAPAATQSPPTPELPSSAGLSLQEADTEARLTASVRETDAQLILRPGSWLETIPQAQKQRIEEHLAPAASTTRKRRLVWIATPTLLLALIVAARLWFFPHFLVTRLDIQSDPEKASIFINNQLMGQTPFLQESIPAGSYALRIEKEGYRPYSRTLVLEHAQTALLVAQLEKSESKRTTRSTAPLVSEAEPAVSPATIHVQAEPERTELPIAQSVIHHHMLGSCTGRLKINGDRISFWSSGNPGDGFTRKITQIDNVELGDKLTIQFKGKTYRFEALARDNKSQGLATFYEHIKKQKALPSKPL